MWWITFELTMRTMGKLWILMAVLVLRPLPSDALSFNDERPDYPNNKGGAISFRDARFKDVVSELFIKTNELAEEPVALLLIENNRKHYLAHTNAVLDLPADAGCDPITINFPNDLTIMELFQYSCEMSNPDLHLYFELGLIIISDKFIRNTDPYVAKYSPVASMHYISCDDCEYYLFGLCEMASGNTFNAVYWTDGKRDAPMLPYTNRLLKCPYCKSLFWPTLFVPVATAETTPSEEDYLIYILHSFPEDPEKEAYVRTRYWWAFNDQYRGSTNEYSLYESLEDNLRELLKLLSVSNEYERIQSAEIYRELGEFDKSLELLDHDFSEDASGAAQQIKELSHQEVKRVKRLDFE